MGPFATLCLVVLMAGPALQGKATPTTTPLLMSEAPTTLQTPHSNTETPIEKSPKTPIEKSPKTPIEKSPKTPIEKSHKTPIEKSPKTPIEKSPKIPIEKSYKTPIEKSPKTPIEKSPKNPIEKSPKTPIEKSPKTPIEKSPKTPIEKSPKTPIEKSPKTPIEKSPKTPIEKSPKTPIEKSPKTSIEKSPKTPIEKSPKTPIEKSPKTPIEKSPKTPIEKSPKTPIENSHKMLSLIGGGKKTHNGSKICQNMTKPVVPVPCSNFTTNYDIYINGSTPCVFTCFYDPQKLSPLRLEVHQHYHLPTHSPTFVSVQQDRYLTSWTLPLIFADNQKFTTLEAILCPPIDEPKEIVQVTISVRGPEIKHLQIGLRNVAYILQKGVNVSVTVTPAIPWYKRYQWAASEESVLVTAESETDICGLMVLQNAECPVNSEVSGMMTRGRYQTFTRQASMVARRTQFPAGVHVIVVSLPDDIPCILNPTDSHDNKTLNGRTKTVVLEVYAHETIATTWYIFLLTAIVLAAIVIAASVVICAFTKRTLSVAGGGCDDEDPLLGVGGGVQGPSYRVEVRGGVLAMGGSQNGPGHTSPCQSNRPHYSGLAQEEEGLEGGRGEEVGPPRGLLALGTSEAAEGGHYDEDQAVVAGQPPFLPCTTHAPAGEALDVNHTFNPRLVLWWKSLAVHEAGTVEAQVSEVGFQNSMIIMGVFAALPTSELLRSYLGMVLHHGREDQCFWNSRCLTAFASLPDFARVFTNIAYVMLGVAFVLIVRKHRTLTHRILKRYRADSVGVSHHYGLYASLGYGLVIQGVMSALYHTCPNSVTIKFDMMFMYVLMVVAVVSIWGLRHADVTHHVYPTVVTVGLALLVAEGRMWLTRGWFWGLLSTVYAILLISNAVLMSTYGVWSFSLTRLWHVWKGWKPLGQNLKNILGEEDTSLQPMQVVRVLVGVGGNVGLILYGSLTDPNVYTYILMVCLVNMSLYFVNYVVMKKLAFKERGTALAWVCLALSTLLWVVALVFFFQRRTDSESSPANSRAKNSPCDFLSVFDEHDMWHITSAFALFFFFVALLTMDDDLCLEPSQKICVT